MFDVNFAVLKSPIKHTVKLRAISSSSCLEAHAGFFQIVYEEDIGCLFTVTFWEKVNFHIINTR